MKKLALLVLTATLCGCPSLNSAPESNHSCSEMKKPCSCPGMEQCGKNADGTTCCKPDECACKQITAK